MKNEPTTEYHLRGVPESLWRRVRATAAMRGETVRAAILRLLTSYAK
jgi:hypothetical protein